MATRKKGDDRLATEPFRTAIGLSSEWHEAAAQAVASLGGPRVGENVGFVYVTDAFADKLGPIVEQLTALTGIANWVGTVGFGVIAGDRTAYDRAALAIMTGAFPEGSFTLFDCVAPERHPDDAGELAAGFVHVDPRHQQAGKLVQSIAQSANAWLVGGVTAARGGRFDQVSGIVTDGGLSGILFAPTLQISTGVTQGCRPIGPYRMITAARDSVIQELDGGSPLQALLGDLSDAGVTDLRSVGQALYAGLPVANSDTGDYVVRDLTAVDADRGWISIAERVEAGQSLVFCKRDRAAAEADLAAMAKRARSRMKQVRGGLYVSCVARGPHLFASAQAEVKILQEALGGVPLVGFYANGEIACDRIYAYTGVLALF
jgi:small ligand-binding sensory domain FIST